MTSNNSDELGPLKSPIAEIRHGFRILTELMSSTLSHINEPFIARVDVEGLGLTDYLDIIKEPRWLEKSMWIIVFNVVQNVLFDNSFILSYIYFSVEENFLDNSYSCIVEFVCDFRLMLLNCYRFNGVESRISKMASALEAIFEQKLALLPEEMRLKCLPTAIFGDSPIPGCRENFFNVDLNTTGKKENEQEFLNCDKLDSNEDSSNSEWLLHCNYTIRCNKKSTKIRFFDIWMSFHSASP